MMARVARHVRDRWFPTYRVGAERFHRRDFMLNHMIDRGDAEPFEGYLASGRDTVDLCCRLVELAGERPDELEWMEIGCGYGRVVRALLDRVPPAQVAVADPITEATEFCTRHLGVRAGPVIADVVIAISVLTHLPTRRAEALLTGFNETVGEGGLVIFTTHGRCSARMTPGFDSGEHAPEPDALIAGLDGDGAVFAAYPNEPDGTYGLAWHDPSWVCAAMARQCGQFELVAFVPSRMFGHQDVWVYRRHGSDGGAGSGAVDTAYKRVTDVDTASAPANATSELVPGPNAVYAALPASVRGSLRTMWSDLPEPVQDVLRPALRQPRRLLTVRPLTSPLRRYRRSGSARQVTDGGTGE